MSPGLHTRGVGSTPPPWVIQNKGVEKMGSSMKEHKEHKPFVEPVSDALRWVYPDLPLAACRVYLVMRDYGAICYELLERIASRSACNESTVTRSLRVLRAAGLIKTVNPSKRSSRHYIQAWPEQKVAELGVALRRRGIKGEVRLQNPVPGRASIEIPGIPESARQARVEAIKAIVLDDATGAECESVLDDIMQIKPVEAWFASHPDKENPEWGRWYELAEVWGERIVLEAFKDLAKADKAGKLRNGISKLQAYMTTCCETVLQRMLARDPTPEEVEARQALDNGDDDKEPETVEADPEDSDNDDDLEADDDQEGEPETDNQVADPEDSDNDEGEPDKEPVKEPDKQGYRPGLIKYDGEWMTEPQAATRAAAIVVRRQNEREALERELSAKEKAERKAAREADTEEQKSEREAQKAETDARYSQRSETEIEADKEYRARKAAMEADVIDIGLPEPDQEPDDDREPEPVNLDVCLDDLIDEVCKDH